MLSMIGSMRCIVSSHTLLQDLLFTVRQRLEKAVASTRLPPWPAAATATSRRATIFLARRFGKALRLLHSILAFDGFLPRRSAGTPALGQLICLPSVIVRLVPAWYKQTTAIVFVTELGCTCKGVCA